MITAPADGLVYACMTHVPLTIEFPSFVTPLYLGQAQGPDRLNLRDLAPEWEPWHPVLGGSAGAFALKNWLVREHPNATQVGICQYRKFMTRSRIGVPATNYQVMDLLPSARVRTAELEDLMHPAGHEFLISLPGQFRVGDNNFDYLYQYKDVHHVEDLLRFTAAAVEVGALHKNEVHPFLGEKVFFCGGIELGIFPAAFWVRNMTALEATVRECVRAFPQRREGAQARSWAFCMERLGSWMLLRHLRQHQVGNDLLKNHVGFLNLVTEAEGQQYTPGV